MLVILYTLRINYPNLKNKKKHTILLTKNKTKIIFRLFSKVQSNADREE